MQSLKIKEKIYGLEHPNTINNLQNYGIFLRNISRLDESLIILKKSDQAHKNLYGEDSLERAYPLSALGQTEFLLKNYKYNVKLVYRYAIWKVIIL